MSRRTHLLNFAFWTLVGAFQASTWVLTPWVAGTPLAGRLVSVAMFNAYVWALLTPAVFRLGAWVYHERHERLRRVAIVIALGLGLSAIVTVMVSTAYRAFIPLPAPKGGGGPNSWFAVWHTSRWFGQQLLEFSGIIIAAIATEMRHEFHLREREAVRLQAQASQLQAQGAELQAQLAEARLTVLRARLNPHFLFNTLNAVSALVAKDPRGVRNMIALLGELLRHALADSKEQEIALREELRLLQLYLRILEIRYQGQLHIVVAADPDVQDALVPNLILQPLVENAVKHGIDRAGGFGTIEVRAHRLGEELVLTVRDTGPGPEPSAPSSSSGVGLRLTRERLVELYGREQRVELEPQEDGGMRALIALPYHTSDDLIVAEEVAGQ